jgi:MFS family permease
MMRLFLEEPFWRRRTVLFTFIGYFLSLFGTTFSQIAINLWVIQETGSAKLMATLMVSGMIIGVLFGSLGGTIADRFERQRIMWMADFAQFVLFATLAYLMWMKAPFAWILLLNIISAFVGVFHGPAFQAAFTDIVGKSNISKASGIITILDNVARISGLALGGVIVGLWNGSTAIAFDAITYLICGLFILMAGKFPIPEGKSEVRATFKKDYVDGFKRIWSDSFTKNILFVFPFLFMVFSSSFMLIQILIVREWKVTPFQYGFIETAVPLGYIIGASLIIWLDKRLKDKGKYIIWSMILTAPIYVSLSFSNSIYAAFPHILVIGFLFAFSTQFLFILMRTKVESVFQGRLFGIMGTLGGVAPPAGIAISSFFADEYGASVVLLANGVFLLMLGFMAMFFFKALWRAE